MHSMTVIFFETQPLIFNKNIHKQNALCLHMAHSTKLTV